MVLVAVAVAEPEGFADGLLCLKCLLDSKVQKVVGYVNLSSKERLKQGFENHQLIEGI